MALRKGFTLIELMVVVLLLALLFMVVFPNLEAFSPTYRLRAMARLIGSTMEEARSESVMQGETFGIRYDFDRQKFGLLLPPNFSKDKRFPSKEREVLREEKIDADLELSAIILPDNSRTSGGVKDLDLDAFGKEGSHIVEIKTKKGRRMWIKFNAFTGSLTYSEKEIHFYKNQ